MSPAGAGGAVPVEGTGFRLTVGELLRIMVAMAKVCSICGKGPAQGHVFTRKGKAKKEGGVGRHIARKSIRRFMPNLQPARVLINGHVKKIKVCTRCIKGGRVHRVPVRRAAA